MIDFRLLAISSIIGLSPVLTTPALAAPSANLCVENRDSVAVVIGNKDYRQSAPEVPYALNDARAIRKFLIDRLCYREGNIILLENATYVDLLSTFGGRDTPEGKLWNWVRKGRSNVFVYYSGHGAPDIRTGDGFLVPIDGDPDDPRFGLSLQTLVTNLKTLKQQRVGADRHETLMLDACFSGREGTGKPLIKGSFSGWKPRRPDPGDDILQFSAAAADEIARWDEDKKHGLFTRVFLDAVSGEADRTPAGNGDGTVTGQELSNFLRNEVSYLARRRYGDDQMPELPKASKIPWRLAVGGFRPPVLTAIPKAKPVPPVSKRAGETEEIRKLRQQAEKGDADAMTNLGVMYRKGTGVAQDDAAAVRWYRKAAEKGNAKAMYNLGFMYREGRGLTQDDAEAVRWYRKAAEKGQVEAVRARIAESIGPEARVKLDAIVLAWTVDGGPRVRLRGLTISDKNSGFAADLPTTDVRVKGWDLVVGRFTPQNINLYSPRLAIPVDEGSSRAPDILLQSAHRSLDELKKSARAIGLIGIDVNDATVELRSTDPNGHSRTWSDIRASLVLEPVKKTLALYAKGIGYDGAWSISARHEPHSSRHGATLTVAANDITLYDILGANAGLPTASAMRIPLYPDFSARFDDGGTLRDAELKIIVGAGYIEFGDDDTQLLDKALLDLYWAPDKRSLEIRPSVVEFGETVFRFVGRVVPPTGPDNAIWKFGIFSEDSTIASDSVDGPPAKLDAIFVSGSIDFDSLLIDIAQFGVKAGKPALAGRGHVDLGAFGPKISVDLSVLPVSARLVKQLWPGFVAPPARRWVMANVGDGEEVDGYVRATIGEAELDGDPETFGWGDDDVHVSFKAKNVDVKTFGALPRLQIDTLNGRIAGGLFEADVASGSMATPSGGRVRISDGRFVIGDIRLPNQIAHLRLSLSGAAKSVGEVVDSDPIGAIRRIGVSPTGLKGKVEGVVRASFALFKDLPFDDIDWSLKAQLSGFGSKEPIAGRKVEKGDLTLDVNGAAAKISGRASFDGTVASVDLVEPFDGSKGGVSKIGIPVSPN